MNTRFRGDDIRMSLSLLPFALIFFAIHFLFPAVLLYLTCSEESKSRFPVRSDGGFFVKISYRLAMSIICR